MFPSTASLRVTLRYPERAAPAHSEHRYVVYYFYLLFFIFYFSTDFPPSPGPAMTRRPYASSFNIPEPHGTSRYPGRAVSAHPEQRPDAESFFSDLRNSTFPGPSHDQTALREFVRHP
jgi:hypothetical protein